MKLVILDRDGTINEDSAEYIKSPSEWQPLPGALEAIARLNHAGWQVVVATNQSGLVDAIFFCPHAPDEGCRCRKPEPGLFEQIGERYGVDLNGVPAVGDSPRDLVAAMAAGCGPHLVLTGKAFPYRSKPLPPGYAGAEVVHQDLAAFADYLIALDARPSQPAELGNY